MAVAREGPFWDAMDGQVHLPPAAVTLGWELIAVSPQDGTIEVAFNASEAFLNPAGFIQGGFLAAMLDETLGSALVAGLSAGDFPPTTDLHVLPGLPVAATPVSYLGLLLQRHPQRVRDPWRIGHREAGR